MDLSDDELRALVREVIAARAPVASPEPGVVLADRAPASHRTFALVSGDADGACLIEPTVSCNHCGYCLSFGH
jgi:hypothetical protein